MKLGKAITAGFGRAARSIKPILIIWLFSVVGISILALPIKSAILSEVGSSLSTELIKETFSVDFWTGLDLALPVLGGLMKGFLYLILIYFFLNVFLLGGLFDSLRANECSYPLKDFFKASASNFLSFLGATLMVILMIIFATGLIIGVPVLIAQSGDSGEGAIFKILKIARIFLFLAIPIFLLVIDYSRAWLAANNKKAIFKALGYGFKATFSSFLSSYLFIIIVLAVQFGLLFLASKVLGFNPDSSGGLFILFLATQLMFIVKLFLRAWRYGGVTTLFTI